MKHSDTNPVILYKQQGASQPDECDDLSDNDFVLAPLQTDMMRKLSNGRVVCVDRTHVTNGYDISLLTVVV